MNKKKLTVILFLFPWLVGFIVFLFGPILASFYFSFTEYDVLRKPLFIGFDNYNELFKDKIFWTSLKITFIYAIVTLPLSVIVGISLALLLNKNSKGIEIYRTCFYIPSIVPLVASSIVWMWIFRGDDTGLFNALLKVFKIKGPLWFSDPKWAMIPLILMSIWSIGNSVLIYLAGLQNIPKSLYEAADLDGASPIRKLFLITIPMLSPTILFNVTIGIISVFQYFVPAYVMTSGGPQNATTFYSLYAYQSAFEDFKFGYASAMAWILFIIVIFFTGLAFKSLSDKVHY